MPKAKNKKFLLISLALLMSIFVLTGCSKVGLTGITDTGDKTGAPTESAAPLTNGDAPLEGMTPIDNGGPADEGAPTGAPFGDLAN